MKYCDKVISINADGENYESGLRVELTHLEISLIYKAIEEARELEELNPIYKTLGELLEKFDNLQNVSKKGLTNYEM